uniref:Uncharacterized protein n=1 Tax=Arundo donax TaxID=35708 RepID=A0A0A9FKV1_ARUDO
MDFTVLQVMFDF